MYMYISNRRGCDYLDTLAVWVLGCCTNAIQKMYDVEDARYQLHTNKEPAW